MNYRTVKNSSTPSVPHVSWPDDWDPGSVAEIDADLARLAELVEANSNEWLAVLAAIGTEAHSFTADFISRLRWELEPAVTGEDDGEMTTEVCDFDEGRDLDDAVDCDVTVTRIRPEERGGSNA
jgi:hypothetical protein